MFIDQIVVKNQNFGQKLEFCSEIERFLRACLLIMFFLIGFLQKHIIEKFVDVSKTAFWRIRARLSIIFDQTGRNFLSDLTLRSPMQEH
mgnify:CR=1 FL=1